MKNLVLTLIISFLGQSAFGAEGGGSKAGATSCEPFLQKNLITSYLISVTKYLQFLDKHFYHLDLDNKNDDNKQVAKKRSSFYKNLIHNTDNISERINLINKLPDFNDSQLKTQKELLIKMIIDLDILTNIKNTTSFLKDILNHQRQEKAHSQFETLFNQLYNSSQIILQNNNKIYTLELEKKSNNEENKPMDTTFYNYLPENITGTLSLWNMKISTQKYQELVDLDSSDEDEATTSIDYDINKQQKDYPFATKSQFMEILTDLNKQNYTSIHVCPH